MKIIAAVLAWGYTLFASLTPVNRYENLTARAFLIPRLGTSARDAQVNENSLCIKEHDGG
jgi:hypothetical protein